MTNQEVMNLFQGIQGCGNLTEKEGESIKFSYAIAKNFKAIQKLVETIQEERNKINKSCGEKDKKGNLIAKEDGSFKIVETEKHEKQMRALMEIENKDIKLHKIKQEDLPKTISPAQMIGIFDIVE